MTPQRKYSYTHLLCFLWCLCAVAADAQTKNITIKVIDSVSQAPLDYVTIAVRHGDSTKIIQGITTGMGVFKFPLDDNIMHFAVSVSRIGYASKEEAFSTDNRIYKIALTPIGDTLSGVVIRGKDITRDVDKLTYKVNPDRYATGTPATRVLADVPLLSVSGSSVSIKNHNNVPVYVNGKSTGSNILNTITADMVERVEVITNPSASTSASGPTSFVNVVLKKPKNSTEMGNIGLVGALPRRLFFPGASYQMTSKKIYFYATVSLQHSLQPFDYYSDRLRNNTGETVLHDRGSGSTTVNATSGNVTFFYDIDSLNEVSMDVSYYNNSFKGDMSSLSQYFAMNREVVQNNLMKNSAKTLQGEFEYKKKFSKTSGLNLNYQHGDQRPRGEKELNEVRQADFLRSNQIYNDSAIIYDNALQGMFYTTLFKKKLSLETGANYKTSNSEDGFLNLFSDGGAMSEVAYNSGLIGVVSRQTAAFISSKFTIAALAFRLGARYEWYRQQIKEERTTFLLTNHFNDLFPNLVVQKKLGKSANIIFNYQRKITRPDISVLSPFLFRYGSATTYEGNPDIRPEYLNVYELEASFQTEKSFYEISPYFYFTRNPIVYLATTNDSLLVNRYHNINRLIVQGVSFSAKNDLNKALQINTNVFAEGYAYSREFAISDRYSGLNMGVSFNVSYDIKKLFSVYGSFFYRKRSYDYQSYTEKNPSVDISFSKNLFNYKVYISVGVKDIFNSGGKTKMRYNDREMTAVYINNAHRRMVSFSVNYSFGKYFWNTKRQNKIVTGDVKSMELK